LWLRIYWGPLWYRAGDCRFWYRGSLTLLSMSRLSSHTYQDIGTLSGFVFIQVICSFISGFLQKMLWQRPNESKRLVWALGACFLIFPLYFFITTTILTYILDIYECWMGKCVSGKENGHERVQRTIGPDGYDEQRHIICRVFKLGLWYLFFCFLFISTNYFLDTVTDDDASQPRHHCTTTMKNISNITSITTTTTTTGRDSRVAMPRFVR
jgi:hypothetical protein